MSVKNVLDKINEIERVIRKGTDEHLEKLKTMIDESIKDESSGTDSYKIMSDLADKSTSIPESTKLCLVGMFNSMSTDEHKHFVMLEKAHDTIAALQGEQVDNKVNKTAHRFSIEKLNNERQIAFGYCLFSQTADGERVVDLQGDTVSPDELENIAYNYVRNHRDVGQMHITSGEGCVVESFVTTPDKLEAMGIKDKLPIAWWVGLYIEDPNVWAKVKSGEYKAFSIEGEAERKEV